MTAEIANTVAAVTPQIELATDFLLSAAGTGAPALARTELRHAFARGDFELARYWRAVRDLTTERLADEGRLGHEYGDTNRPMVDNVIEVDFIRGKLAGA